MTRTACAGSRIPRGAAGQGPARRPRPARSGRRRAADAREAIGRRDRLSSRRLVVFTPSGRRGRFPLGTPLLAGRAPLGVDIDSVCGGRASADAARCSSEGEFAEHGVDLARRASLGASAPSSEPTPRRDPGGRADDSPARRGPGRLVIDVPRGQPGAPAGRAQGRRSASIELDPGRAPALRRGAPSRTCTIPPATCGGSRRRSSASGS